MREKAKPLSIAAGMSFSLAYIVQFATTALQGVPTVPAGDAFASLLLTAMQAQGIIPAVPFGVPTFPDVYSVGVTLVEAFGASVPVEIFAGLLLSSIALIAHQRSS
jgi:hypothetical protein